MNKKVLSVICLVGLAGCGEKEAEQKRPTLVTVTEVRSMPVTEELNYPANVVALKEVELRADVAGYVTDILVRDGQQVREGQVLYQIDQSRYAANLNQAMSRLRVAEANLGKAERDLSRYERLKEGNAVAIQLYEDALTSLSNASQDMLSAEAEVENARVNVEYATIRAPFDGTVGFSSVRLGALVTPGQTLLNVISSDDPIGVDFYADEKSLGFYLSLFSDQTTAKDSIFQITLSEGSIFPHYGQIENIDRAVDPGTGTIQIRLKFANSEGRLKPGMSARLTVNRRLDTPKLTLPQRALVERLGETYVYRAENGRSVQQRVETGARVKERIVVEEGIAEGQKIILDGLQRLSDGDSISIKTEAER